MVEGVDLIRVMEWYHHHLMHPGKIRMQSTMGNIVYWPNMNDRIERFVKSCHKCQIAKKNRKKYGHLLPKKVESTPWNRVNLYLIGPHSVKTPSLKYEFRALTMVDPATNWFEVAVIKNPTSEEAQRILIPTG